MKRRILLALLFCSFLSFAQVSNEGQPKSWTINTIRELPPVVLPAIDLNKYRAEDEVNDLRKDMPWRFGAELTVDYNLNNGGAWTILKNGDRVWRLRFLSQGAHTLNFIFSDFFMPEGASLYLYNNDRSDLLGAYDSAQNNDERVLGTWLVQGEDIWLEYYEPAAVAGEGKLEVFKVVHGYRSQGDYLKSPESDLNGSGNCNYDVNCSMGVIDDMKDIYKNSVGLMISGNSGFCTGSLINNTSNNGVPYFLTANHCYSNPSTWSFRFKWISPNPVCASSGNSTPTTAYHTMSGATLKAKRAASDFCLVQINGTIPESWGLKLAGWDRTTTVPAYSFGIHHPSGDIMKACLDANPPVSFDNNGNYWRIMDWDMGVTEGGSSGSPLFNPAGRIIGQLWRGSANCSGTTDNGGSDDYGRLNISWNTGTTADARLRDWLDPTNTNATTADVYPPVIVMANDAKIAIGGIGDPVCGNVISPSAVLTNVGSSPLTSVIISYSLNVQWPTEINWTGNLLPGASVTIPLTDITLPAGNNVLYVTAEAPNGVADELPFNNAAQKEIVPTTSYETEQLTLQLTTDNFGYETMWTVRNSNAVLIASGGPYPNNATYSIPVILPAEDCYTFTITDEEGDGICCGYGNGNFSLLTDDGVLLSGGGNFGSSKSVTFHADFQLSASEFSTAAVKVFPNPSAGIFQVTVVEDTFYAVHNMLGQQIQSGTLSQNGPTIDLSNQNSGIYMLTLQNDKGATLNYKLLKN